MSTSGIYNLTNFTENQEQNVPWHNKQGLLTSLTSANNPKETKIETILEIMRMGQ